MINRLLLLLLCLSALPAYAALTVGHARTATPITAVTADWLDTDAGFAGNVDFGWCSATRATADATKTATLRHSFGVFGTTGGITQASVSQFDNDNQATSQTGTWGTNDAVFSRADAAGASSSAEGVITSVQTNGLRIDFTADPNTTADLMDCMMFGGDAYEAKVLTLTFATGTPNDATVAHGLSGTPDFLVAITNRSAVDSGPSNGGIGLGFWDGTNTVGTSTFRSNGAASEASQQEMSATNLFPGFGTTVNIPNVTVQTVDGTNVTLRSDTSTDSTVVYVLAVNCLTTCADKAALFTTRTATGTAADMSGMAVQPQAGLVVGTYLLSLDVVSSTDTADVLSIGSEINSPAGNKVWAQTSIADDGSDPIDANSYVSTARVIQLFDATADTLVHSTTISSWDSGGITHNTTTADSLARYSMMLAVGAAAADTTAPSITVAPAQAAITTTTVDVTLTATDASGNYTGKCGLYNNGSTPTAQQIYDQTGTGVIASSFDTDAQASGAQATLNVTQGTASTARTVACTAYDADLNKATAQHLNVTFSAPPDTTAPVFTVAPNETSNTTTTSTLSMTATDASGSLTYKCGLYDAASTPTAQNVYDEAGTGVIASSFDTDAQSSGVAGSITVTQGTASASKRVACTAYDAALNKATVAYDDVTFDAPTAGALPPLVDESSGAGTGASLTISHDFGSDPNRATLACTTDEHAASTTGVQIDCNSNVFVVGPTVDGGGSSNGQVQTFYAMDSVHPTGTCDVTFFRSTTGGFTAHLVTRSGVEQEVLVTEDKDDFRAAASTPLVSDSIVTTVDNSVIEVCGTGNNATAFDVVASQIEHNDFASGNNRGVAFYKERPTAGATTVTLDPNSIHAYLGLVAYVLEPVVVVAPAVVDVIINAAFTGAAGSLTGYTPEVNSPGNAFTINSFASGFGPGTATGSSNAALLQAQTMLVMDVEQPSHYCEVSWTPTSGNLASATVSGRWSGTNNYFRLSCLIDNSPVTNYCVFSKRLSDVETTISTVTDVVTAGQVHKLRLYTHGNHIGAYLTSPTSGYTVGSRIGFADDSALATNTKCGFGVGGADASQPFDNFYVRLVHSAVYEDTDLIDGGPDSLFAGMTGLIEGDKYVYDPADPWDTTPTTLAFDDGGRWYALDFNHTGTQQFGALLFKTTDSVMGVVPHAVNVVATGGGVAAVWGTIDPRTLSLGVDAGVFDWTTELSTACVPTCTFAVTSGALPPGRVLASSGIETGIPTGLATNPVKVTATNPSGAVQSGNATITVTWDNVPDPTNFADVVDLVPSATNQQCVAITPTGYDGPATATVSAGCKQSINGAAFTASSATINPGNSYNLSRDTVASTYDTSISCTGTITTVPFVCNLRTIVDPGTPVDDTPDVLVFPSALDQPLNTVVYAGATQQGTDNGVQVDYTATGGTIGLDNGNAVCNASDSYAASLNNVEDDDLVCARHTTSSAVGTAAGVQLTGNAVVSEFGSVTSVGSAPFCEDIPTQLGTVGLPIEPPLNLDTFCTGVVNYGGTTTPFPGGVRTGATISGVPIREGQYVSGLVAANQYGSRGISLVYQIGSTSACDQRTLNVLGAVGINPSGAVGQAIRRVVCN